MKLFFYTLKDQVNVLSLLFFMSFCAWLFFKHKKKSIAIFLTIATVVIFLLSATKYLPVYLAQQLEKKYLPFDISKLKNTEEKYYILMLGSGVNLDKRLPATSQLGNAAIGRFIEAIRINRLIKNSIIVSSGNSMLGLETQASVVKRAAVVMGVDSNNVERLDNPSTTKEEADALLQQYGNNIKLILVSDAMHLPRAMQLFEKIGFQPIAAPTNYRAPAGSRRGWFDWWPTTVNMNLMDIVMHEYLGRLKASL